MCKGPVCEVPVLKGQHVKKGVVDQGERPVCVMGKCMQGQHVKKYVVYQGLRPHMKNCFVDKMERPVCEMPKCEGPPCECSM